MSEPFVSPGKVVVYTYAPEHGHDPVACLSIAELLQAIESEIGYMEVGDKLFIKVGEMTPEEYEELPEHPGW
jgi:hypothetical protein